MKTFLVLAVASLTVAAGLISPSLAPCATEDQESPCYWDAGTQGNAHGSSFIVTITGAVIELPTAAK